MESSTASCAILRYPVEMKFSVLPQSIVPDGLICETSVSSGRFELKPAKTELN